jgi:TonB family protein
MTPASSLSAWHILGYVGNHLWQSTLFTLAVALLALAFRHQRAQVRHWLWFAASVKFLVPFAPLVAMGGLFGLGSAPALAERGLTWGVLGQPFSPLGVGSVVWVSPLTASATSGALGSWLLLGIWLCGCLVMVAAWVRQWRRVTAIIRQGSPVADGRTLDAARRLEGRHGLKGRVPLVFSGSSLEPAVFGVVKPRLLVPRSITDHLGDAEMEAVLSHEMAHVRRRDNLTSAVQMVVEVLFWFYPVVWWLGARLVAERERACDEDVIRTGSEPKVYAESILKTCRCYIESPLACLSGVTGSDLKQRIEVIMKNNSRKALGIRQRAFLGSAAIVAIAGPVVVGAMSTPRSTASVDDPGVSGVELRENALAPSASVAPPTAGSAQDGGRAASAAPEPISANATVMNWDGTIVNQGDNGWTCLPDHPDTQGTDPWCFTDTSLIELLPDAIRVGGNIAPPKKVGDVPPSYPPAAQEAGATGIVILEVVIGPDGTVGGLRTLQSSGNELLDQSAFEAVRGWRYESTSLNGRPVPVIMAITVNYTLK